MQKYYLRYAETPRRWSRVIVSVHFSTDSGWQSAIPQLPAPDNIESACNKVLPGALQSLLDTLLPSLEFFDSVTSLAIRLREDGHGRVVVDSPRVEAVEDVLETELSGENQMLQDIEDLGCAQFLESEVIVESRISSSRYLARVESQLCIEQKVPFASAGRQGENGFRDFFADIKLRLQQHC